MTCINNGDTIGTLFLDFRKAFGLVNHSILIQVLYRNFHFTNSVAQHCSGSSLILIVDNKQLIMVKDYLSSRNFSQVSLKGPY